MATFPNAPALTQPSLLGGRSTAVFNPLGQPPASGPAVIGGGGPKVVRNIQAPSSGNLTIDALMQRQKQAQAAQEQNMSQPATTITGGIAQMAGTFFNALNQRRAEQEQSQAWGDISQAMGQIDPTTGVPSNDVISAIMQRSPELGLKLYETAMAARTAGVKEDQWTQIQTPEGENGQWFQNQHGETKKVGGAADTSMWKPSDIAARADDYSKLATVYNNASPSWVSMKEAANTAMSPEGTVEGKGAADYNMIVAYAKLLDPNSVVREGEVKSAALTGGVLDQLQGWLNTWKSEGSLNDAVRRGIMHEAESRMKAYYGQAKASHDWISGVATRHKVDPNDVVPPLPAFEGWTEDDDPNKKYPG